MKTEAVRGIALASLVVALHAAAVAAQPPGSAPPPEQRESLVRIVGDSSRGAPGRVSGASFASPVKLSPPSGPVRLSQLPGAAEPAPALPEGPREITPQAPAAAPPAAAPPFPLNYPLVPVLPPELRRPQPSPATEARFERFVPRIIDPQSTLELVVGRPRILALEVAPLQIYIPNEDVAQFQVLDPEDPREIAVVGRSPGVTVLTLWMPDPEAPGGRQILSYYVQVHPDQETRVQLEAVFKSLEQDINRSFPDADVCLSLIGDQVIVQGQAKDSIEAAQILRIVAAHRPRTGADALPASLNVAVSSAVTQFDILGGPQVAQQEAAEIASDAVQSLYLESRYGIVNRLRIPGEQQVMLRVTVAEVNRTAARSIGLNFSIANSQTTVFETFTGGVFANANILATLDNGQVQLAINALRELSLARTLAEPNLVTLNGRPASFRAGGAFPIPVVTGATATGLQGTAFQPFGTELTFTPFITDRDRIRLQIQANISSVDPNLTTTIGANTSVPGLNSREFQTTVEMREGQTFAVAGLIQNGFTAASSRVPFWGDLPLIGATGGFNQTSGQEQELIILITPELVHPLEACHTPPLPGADVIEPTDIEFYLLNRLESRRANDYRSPVRTDYHRIRNGDRFCEDPFIIGPTGQTYGCCGHVVPELPIGPLP